MRTSALLVATAAGCLAGANLIRWGAVGAGDVAPVNAYLQVQETGSSVSDERKGWTPKPTPAPGLRPESDIVLELLKRADEDDDDDKQTGKLATTWTNDRTCGWSKGSSSAPWTCGEGSKCATNKQNVVACVSGTFSPFFTVCLDYNAFKAGACKSIGPQTGCCQESSAGACGTFLWTGAPARSMYRCFANPGIISMNDHPQFVLDALTRTSTTSSTTSTSSTTTAAPTNTGQLGTTAGDDKQNANGGGSGGTNIGAIVGGVVGGIGGLALIAAIAAFVILRNKKRKSKRKHDAATYSAVQPQDPSAGGHYDANSQTHQAHLGPAGRHPSPSMSYTGSSAYAPTTFPPQSPYNGGQQQQHDPRQTFYDPAQQPQPQQQMYGAYAPQPGSPDPNKLGVGGGGFGPPSAELDSTPRPGYVAPQPHQSPIEMGTENYR